MKQPDMKLTDIKLTDRKMQDMFQVAEYNRPIFSRLWFIVVIL